MAERYPKTYIVTTAQKGAEPCWEFLKGLEKIAKEKKAEIMILPVNGSQTGKKAEEETLHQYLKDNFQIVKNSRPLNADVYILQDLTIPAQSAEPLRGISRHIKPGKTAIIPSTKLMMKCYPDASKLIPKIITTTGAITNPNYQDNRTGQTAELDHHPSAIIVELKDRHVYHFRQLNPNKSGVFYDLGYRYEQENEPAKEPLEAMVLGDWHEGYTSEKVIKATKRMIEELKPKVIVLHDLFDGDAINYFHENNILAKAKKAAEGMDALQPALNACWQRLVWFRGISSDSEIWVVKSNHDERLNRYLEEMRFKEDAKNAAAGGKLFSAMYEGKDPIVEGIRIYGGQILPGIKFLKRDASNSVSGWTLSVHGDLGPNGHKASTKTIEKSYGEIITAHGHNPEIYRNVWRVGTSTDLHLDYNLGRPCNWLNTHAILPKNRCPQLVNIIGGEYKIS
jgi:hypothetical protein